MLERVALVDGEFLRGLCADFERQTNIEIFSNILWERVRFGSRRVFFYDSLPVRKGNQNQTDFELELECRVAELNKIRSTTDFHVRDGVSRLRRTQNRREQKGVDILLAIDAMRFAFQGTAQQLTIVTSDMDFFPVFEALQQTSCRGVLRYQADKTSDELIYCADEATPIFFQELINWCNNETVRRLFGAFEKIDNFDRNNYFEFVSENGQPIWIRFDEISAHYYIVVRRGKYDYGMRSTPLSLVVEETLRQHGGGPVDGSPKEIVASISNS